MQLLGEERIAPISRLHVARETSVTYFICDAATDIIGTVWMCVLPFPLGKYLTVEILCHSLQFYKKLTDVFQTRIYHSILLSQQC